MSFRGVCAADTGQLRGGGTLSEFVVLGPEEITVQGIGDVDPDAAVNLLGGRRNASAGVGRPELRDPRCPECLCQGASVGDQPGRVPGGPSNRLDVDEGVGQPLLYGLA